MERFHAAAWQERYDIAQQLMDERVSEFSRRLIYTDYPAVLPKNETIRLKEWALNRITTTNDVPWMTIPKALAELEEHAKAADNPQQDQIADIKIYINGLVEKIEKW